MCSQPQGPDDTCVGLKDISSPARLLGGSLVESIWSPARLSLLKSTPKAGGAYDTSSSPRANRMEFGDEEESATVI